MGSFSEGVNFCNFLIVNCVHCSGRESGGGGGGVSCKRKGLRLRFLVPDLFQKIVEGGSVGDQPAELGEFAGVF